MSDARPATPSQRELVSEQARLHSPSTNLFAGDRSSSPVSQADSGIALSDSPSAKRKGKLPTIAIEAGTPTDVRTPIDSLAGESDQDTAAVDDTESEEDGTIIPKDSLQNEQSRIMFEAADKVRSYCSGGFLKIPQLVVVGSQSSGKSSLLQTLTNMPFPIGDGCCTRFPIRVVSMRSKPGSSETFRITVEKPEVTVPELSAAGPEATKFKAAEGGVLTLNAFKTALDEISEKYLKIRPGRGPDKRNFVANVVKIELSGPQRTQFSILDLPGLFASHNSVNKEEFNGVREMAIAYMRKPETIVICVAQAIVELGDQVIDSLALEHADPRRIVAVRTKCDKVTATDEIERLAAESVGEAEEGAITMPNGWFVVRNRTRKDDPATFDLDEAEARLFSSHSWSKVPASKRGSAALKVHLANVLSSNIATAFPSLVADIKTQLASKEKKLKDMGKPRDSHTERATYVKGFVDEFCRYTYCALNHPGYLDDDRMELRSIIQDLNTKYDIFMRNHGHKRTFWDHNLDVDKQLRLVIEEGLNNPDRELPRYYKPPVNEGNVASEFEPFSAVEPVEEFANEIGRKMEKFKAGQLPGIINPGIYHAVYKSQVSKWWEIASTHFDLVKQAIEKCYRVILDKACPSSCGDTGQDGSIKRLHNSLAGHLDALFLKTCTDTKAALDKYCEEVTKCERLDMLNPEFVRQLGSSRRLRHFETCISLLKAVKPGEKLSHRDLFAPSYELLGYGTERHMFLDVNDVVQIYYNVSTPFNAVPRINDVLLERANKMCTVLTSCEQIALDSFVRHITTHIIGSFISDKAGPLLGLTHTYIEKLSEEAVEEMAGESEATVQERQKLKDGIDRLSLASATVEKALKDIQSLATAA